jgi:predicted transcriptional regulator
MKSATLPPLRVEPGLRREVERLLAPGETLSVFVEQAVRQSVARRADDAAFAKRALASRAQGQRTGRYHSAEKVLEELKALAKPSRGRRARRT